MKTIFTILKNINNEKEISAFLNEILTKNELDTLTKRWRILEMLSESKTQRQIANELNVSLCKVTRGAKILKNENSITARYLKRK